jgi:hypothetical protein
MAKGQQRGNREIRKPKANRLVVVVEPQIPFTKQTAATVSTPKKKG